MDEPHEIERLSPSVVRVPLITPTIPPATRTNTFLVTANGGHWIVDPGSPHTGEIDRLLGAIDELPGGRRMVRGYVVTHRHRDHWAGLERLKELAPAPATPADLVPHIYAAYPPFLYSFAARSVLAHLIKLGDEGLVRSQGEKWVWIGEGGADAS